MIDITRVYASKNDGDFKVTKYNNYASVEVEFIFTGYRLTTRSDHVLDGAIKDKLKPSLCGVGFIGHGNHKASIKGKHTKQYSVWMGMITRCYNESSRYKWPTYKGCSVSIEWLNFQTFAEWFDNNYIDGYHLDKDIKLDGNKVYSASNCCFVSRTDNNVKAHAKTHKLISPEGHKTTIYNLAEFCRTNGLDRRSMSAVSVGKDRSYKGWNKQ